MKKLIIPIIAAATMGLTAHAAEITGSILATDIGTLIDGAACKTYNVDGRTFVIAEDLRGYGFDVVYNDSSRRLTITQNPYAPRTLLQNSEVNVDKNAVAVGNPLGNMYATDIKVYLDNTEIEGYAIDGRMVIPVRSLEPCAYVSYNEREKLVTVSGLQHYLTNRYESGNPNVTLQSNHSYVEVEDDHNLYNIPSMQISAADSQYGSITASWGNPYIDNPYSDYHKHFYSYEAYTIKDSQGRLIYDTYIKRDYYKTRETLITEYGYVRTDSFAALLDSWDGNMYGYGITKQKNYVNYWPTDTLASPDEVNFTGLMPQTDITYSTEFYALTDNNLLCSINSNKDISIVRHNIIWADNNLFLSADGTLYKSTITAFSNEVNSIFDECIEQNIKKTNSYGTTLLTKDGELYHKSNSEGTHVRLSSGISDFGKLMSWFATVDSQGNLRIGTADEYLANSATIVADNVRSVSVAPSGFYGLGFFYITNDNTLRFYDLGTWSSSRITSDIAKTVNTEWFITTDARLYNNRYTAVQNVKDAVARDNSVLYVLQHDNTILCVKYGQATIVF